MSRPPDPTHPLALPSAQFTIPSSDPSLLSLRIKTTPHVLVPLPLISPLIFGRRLEDCVDVIVPVGGKIRMRLEVCTNDLKRGEGESAAERIGTIMRSALIINHEILGLSSLEPVIDVPLDGFSHPSTSRTFMLNPKTASPNHNPLSTNMISTGHPIAHLVQMDIQCSWTSPRSCPDQPTQESQGSDTVQEDDDFILDDQVDTEPCQASEEDKWLHGMQEGTGETSWQDHQLNDSIEKFIRTHLIKRFPMVFDGGLLAISPSFRLPSPLISSITHFLQTSSTHETALTAHAKEIIINIIDLQDNFLNKRVQQAVVLPARKDRKLERARKKRRTEADRLKEREPLEKIKNNGQEIRSRYQASGMSQMSTTSEANRHDPDIQDPEERAGTYLAQVKHAMGVSENDAQSRGEVRLKRVLGDSLAFIGKSIFQARRRTGGRMAYGRIKVVHHGETLLTAHSPPVGDGARLTSNIYDHNQAMIDEILEDLDEVYDPAKKDDTSILLGEEVAVYDVDGCQDFMVLDDLWDDLLDECAAVRASHKDPSEPCSDQAAWDESDESLYSLIGTSHSYQSTSIDTPSTSMEDCDAVFDDLEDEDSQSKLRSSNVSRGLFPRDEEIFLAFSQHEFESLLY
ncbi:hypothetical protein IAR55_003547 [Kwoniella newhampshirensis]|uniref:Uncharacterized protein n=1 Tax=Kwoniella newhampshirensis TaxID=1651941 RepID=A0AAW0Z1D3_9TREE